MHLPDINFVVGTADERLHVFSVAGRGGDFGGDGSDDDDDDAADGDENDELYGCDDDGNVCVHHEIYVNDVPCENDEIYGCDVNAFWLHQP